jgi:hypothetical protein
MRDAERLQPVRQCEQTRDGRGELRQMRHALPVDVRCPDARRDLRLVHVKPRDALEHLLKHRPIAPPQIEDHRHAARRAPPKQTSLI